MKEILFVTGNDRKLAEAQAGCKDFGVTVKQLIVAIDEIQSHDPLEISKRKAEDAYAAAQSPVVITDTSWDIPALNGFPGGYMKDVAAWFTADDFVNLVRAKEDREISFTETIVYKDAEKMKVFTKKYVGQVSDVPRGNGNSIEQVTEFEGKTIAEKHDLGEFSHDPKEYVWYEFARWYKEQ